MFVNIAVCEKKLYTFGKKLINGLKDYSYVSFTKQQNFLREQSCNREKGLMFKFPTNNNKFYTYFVVDNNKIRVKLK